MDTRDHLMIAIGVIFFGWAVIWLVSQFKRAKDMDWVDDPQVQAEELTYPGNDEPPKTDRGYL